MGTDISTRLSLVRVWRLAVSRFFVAKGIGRYGQSLELNHMTAATLIVRSAQGEPFCTVQPLSDGAGGRVLE
jgi:hypothetical protein